MGTLLLSKSPVFTWFVIYGCVFFCVSCFYGFISEVYKFIAVIYYVTWGAMKKIFLVTLFYERYELAP